ncbi:hypothetical protein P7K49_040985, partial [Saguinus oedipus]
WTGERSEIWQPGLIPPNPIPPSQAGLTHLQPLIIVIAPWHPGVEAALLVQLRTGGVPAEEVQAPGLMAAGGRDLLVWDAVILQAQGMVASCQQDGLSSGSGIHSSQGWEHKAMKRKTHCGSGATPGTLLDNRKQLYLPCRANCATFFTAGPISSSPQPAGL